MSLQDTIAADQQAVSDAQAALDAANAKLAADQAAFDAAQPHLSMLAEIESFAASVSADARDAFNAAITKARELF